MPLTEIWREGGWRRAALVAAPLVVIGVALVMIRDGSVHRLSVRAPVPLSSPVGVVMNELTPSVFTIPVRVALEPLVEEVERALPRAFGDMENRRPIEDRDDLEVAFRVERSPVRARFTDSIVTLSTTLTYSARAWFDRRFLPEVSASCGTGEGEPRPRLSVSLVTPVSLDRDWRIRSRIEVGRITPASEETRDRCRVTFLSFDMTSQVVDAARDLVERMGPRADSAIAEVDVRAQFQEWWDLIAQPVRLADDVWLLLTPEAVGRGEIHGTGQGIETSLTMRARPRVVVSLTEPLVGETPLPPLETVEGDDRLRIFAEAQADYGELAELLVEEFGDQDLSAAGRTLQVVGVTIKGVGDGRISMALEVKGDVRGELFLVGTPMFDALSGRVSVPDLNFDVATQEALVSGAAWVARVGLVELFRDKAHWPSAAAIDWARTQVELGFNSRLSDEVRLEGEVDTVSVLGVTAGLESIRIRAEVRGTARLVVTERGSGN